MPNSHPPAYINVYQSDPRQPRVLQQGVSLPSGPLIQPFNFSCFATDQGTAYDLVEEKPILQQAGPRVYRYEAPQIGGYYVDSENRSCLRFFAHLPCLPASYCYTIFSFKPHPSPTGQALSLVTSNRMTSSSKGLCGLCVFLTFVALLVAVAVAVPVYMCNCKARLIAKKKD